VGHEEEMSEELTREGKMMVRKRKRPKPEFNIIEWSKDLTEKLKVVMAYSECEAMRHRGETGKRILEKIYPWLRTVDSKPGIYCELPCFHNFEGTCAKRGSLHIKRHEPTPFSYMGYCSDYKEKMKQCL